MSCSGGGYVLLGLLAAVTAGGRWVSVLGMARAGWLAFHELGGDLSRLAHIPTSGPDPLSVASVLLDGMDVVVVDGEVDAPPSRTRALIARVRRHDSVLIVTNSGLVRPDLEIRSRTAGYVGLSAGGGRVRAVDIDVQVIDRVGRRAVTPLRLGGAGDQRLAWTNRAAAAADAAATSSNWTRTG
ncbi:hypothetical protein [Nocardia altamirensis]|uniref:hypothetical protein n=1 Tax=Nocardia altamirensis TaxID=472158 RepID=UPI00114D3229|nr:hypothetical protein [Nocardia altamirensis]